MKILFSNTHYQSKVEYTSLISVVPPLDLAYCAALVRREIPHADVAIIDANAERLTAEDHRNRIVAAKPDVLVITAAVYSINSVRALLGSMSLSETTVVLMGPHGTALPEQTLEEVPQLSVVVRGEPEQTVLELVSSIEHKTDWATVPGIAYRKESVYVETERRPVQHNLDALPFPARDLLPNDRYSSPFSDRVTSIQTTRGCPGRCTFCDSHLVFGPRTRTRNPGRVVDEMQECVEKWRVDYFAVIDHTFTASRTFVQEVCEQIIARGLHRKIRWVCNTRVDMLTDEMLSLMKLAGCLQIGIGIESADNARLARVGKEIDEDQIRNAIIRIKKHGIIAMGYSIVGFPDDTAERIIATGRKIRDFNPHTLQLSFATPLPGTKLRRRCIEEDRILSANWDDYVFLRRSIIRNDTLSTEELETLRRDIVRRFYLRTEKFIELADLLLFRARVSYPAVARAAWKVLRNMAR